MFIFLGSDPAVVSAHNFVFSMQVSRYFKVWMNDSRVESRVGESLQVETTSVRVAIKVSVAGVCNSDCG